MRAIQFHSFGGYDALQLVDLPAPTLSPGEALVAVKYAPVSPLDNTVRAGHLPGVKPPLVPGVNAVGTVVDPGTTSLARGTAVLIGGAGYGTRRDGTWRELLAAPAAELLPIPSGLDLEAVATLAAGAGHLTAYMALTKIVPFAAGQTVLAPGIGGAVGQGGVEIARVLGAKLAISTATRTDKAEQGRADGYEVIDLSKETLRQGVARLTDGRGVDVVLDGVGGPVTGEALASLAPQGHLVSIGYSGGTKTTIDVTDIIWRTSHVHGFMFGLFAPADVAKATQTLFGLLAEKRIRPALARTFPLAEAAAAQKYLIEDRPYGRVLLGV